MDALTADVHENAAGEVDSDAMSRGSRFASNMLGGFKSLVWWDGGAQVHVIGGYLRPDACNFSFPTQTLQSPLLRLTQTYHSPIGLLKSS